VGSWIAASIGFGVISPARVRCQRPSTAGSISVSVASGAGRAAVQPVSGRPPQERCIRPRHRRAFRRFCTWPRIRTTLRSGPLVQELRRAQAGVPTQRLAQFPRRERRAQQSIAGVSRGRIVSSNSPRLDGRHVFHLSGPQCRSCRQQVVIDSR